MLDPVDTDNLALRPNCLLTRSDLVFITGPRSLFWPPRLGAQLQEFIAAHGYRIRPFVLPFRSRKRRNQAFEAWLQQNQKERFHFILASETYEELEKSFDLFQRGRAPIAASTLTLISTKPKESPLPLDVGPQTDDLSLENDLHFFDVEEVAPRPVAYDLHTLFCRFNGTRALPFSHTLPYLDPLRDDRFLDHCIQLAENE